MTFKTQNSHDVAAQGLEEIVKTEATITDLSNDLVVASEEVGRLASLSEQISKVLEMIKGVAEQARGFAGVADEVRTLVGRT
ncbi:hypothetical protein [Shewanella gelidii]|uniref:Methyl-accepting chemotaxis protein n=1 Tax=Shewanella gelidii TaxID=1642821 RepID=A0A917JJI5_9GAMM|nr:hypothetical protein [Shewanella gelidii]MCL1097125.1 hypothetical protein [Shewanella gelidii]GGI72713.1 hypothetical protein GCM10009332_07710 [Shewanella gelidii]